jgi:hypothetical protein
VRLTCKTDKPFFPYSEPGAAEPDLRAWVPPRLLRVYFIGTKRMSGVLGENDAWPGKTVWSNTLPAKDWSRVLDDLKLEGKPVPADAWLTIFEDRASPRPGTADVFFEPSADQNTVKRPDIIQDVYDPDGSIAERDGVKPPPDRSKWIVLILAGMGVLAVVVVGAFLLKREPASK